MKMDDICAGCGKKLEKSYLRDGSGNRYCDMTCVELHCERLRGASQRQYMEARGYK